MRSLSLALPFVIAACAQPGPLPPANLASPSIPSPLTAAPAPIYTPTPIQPRLLPANPATPLTPEQQAAITLQQGIRRDQLNAVDPNRPQSFGDPSALGGPDPVHSDMGDAQYPGMPSGRAPVFRRF